MPEAGFSSVPRSDNRPHAVIIGAGFGGLAAAVRLGAKGYRVTVLEKLDKPGGRAYTYTIDGFTFDAGPTIITAPYLLEELWDLAGKSFVDHVDLRSIDPFYEIRFDDGRTFVYSSDIEAMRSEVAKFNPDDVAGLERFHARSHDIYNVAFAELADVPFSSFSFMLRCFPDMIRLGGHRAVYDVVKAYFKDPLLRIVFSFHPLLIGGNPLTTTAYYCLIAHLERSMGVHYAIGGTGAIIRGLVDLVDGQSGAVRTEAEVARINVVEGKVTGVTLTSGERIDADLVVSNADSAFTYTKLLGHQPRRRWSDGKFNRTEFSMSLFVWYFGTNKKYDDVYHHMMIMGPRYEGLLKDIFNNKVIADDFSLYLHRPTASDPGLAPEGCDAFYVLAPVPHLGSGTDWVAEGERFRQRVQTRLEETVLPGLGDHLAVSHFITPQDFKDRLNSVNGAGFAMQPRLFQSAWFRPHNRSEEVENLYLVGAGTHPGAGVPGVLSSAKVIDRLVPHADALIRAAG